MADGAGRQPLPTRLAEAAQSGLGPDNALRDGKVIAKAVGEDAADCWVHAADVNDWVGDLEPWGHRVDAIVEETLT